ncbi:MAG TPA: uroporphyrinogen decarboxylase [Alphaproteobacteria bacterium]|nr:uroporphyrinogen decarboxylase [Alphaproteobacteria bacterium]
MPQAPELAQAKSFIRALRGEIHAEPPFWFMRQAGRYLPEYRELRARASDFIELCLTPELASEITLQPIRRFAMDAAILFSDILMVPYALGQTIQFREGEGPVLSPVQTSADIDRLAERVDEFARRLEPVFETVRRVSSALPLDTALIGFAGAPWTVATYMVEGGSSRDFSRVRAFAYREPEAFGRLIDLLVEATGIYLVEQIRAGAEAIQIFDSWAGVLPDSEFERWCVRPIQEIVAFVRHRHPAVPIIAFPKGAGVHYRDFAESTGVEAVSLDATVPIDWAAREVQPLATLQGNLDPILLVVGGRPMERAARRILDVLNRGPFVFNLGHGILPETPVENVMRLCEIIHKWRA